MLNSEAFQNAERGTKHVYVIQCPLSERKCSRYLSRNHKIVIFLLQIFYIQIKWGFFKVHNYAIPRRNVIKAERETGMRNHHVNLRNSNWECETQQCGMRNSTMRNSKMRNSVTFCVGLTLCASTLLVVINASQQSFDQNAILYQNLHSTNNRSEWIYTV